MAKRTIHLPFERPISEDEVDGWMYVVITHPTGVRYAQQYGGTACRQGEVEGYVVPTWAPEALVELRDVFEHELGGAGAWNLRWPPGLMDRVEQAVGAIDFWAADADLVEHPTLDRDRLSDLDEAWVPIRTSDGPGVLMWANSD